MEGTFVSRVGFGITLPCRRYASRLDFSMFCSFKQTYLPPELWSVSRM